MPVYQWLRFLGRSAPLPARDDRLLEQITTYAGPLLRRYFNAEVRGVTKIPTEPVLFVGNHSGGVVSPDTLLFCMAVCKERGVATVPYGLVHDLILTLPGTRQGISLLGGIAARADAATKTLARGRNVLVYPGGDLDVFRPYRHRNRIVFGGRRGYVRLALRAGVPIVPVVSAGSHATFVVLDDLRWLARLIRADHWLRVNVWPLCLSLPWGLTLGPLPPFIPLPVPIRTEILAPIRFPRTGTDAARDKTYVRACATEVEAAMQAALDRLAESIGA